MIRPVPQFIRQGFNIFFKLIAYIRVVPQCPGYRGGIYIKFFCNVFDGNPAQFETLVIKYKEFTHSNRLRNRLQMFCLNS